MKDMIHDIIAKICHDLVSPVNGLGLFVESEEDNIPVEHRTQIEKYIENFKIIVSFFRIFGMPESSNIQLSKLQNILSEYADLKKIECKFYNEDVDDVIDASFAKSILYMYLCVNKLLIKRGSVEMFLHQKSINVKFTSEYQINDFKFDDGLNDSRDVFLKIGKEEIIKRFGKQISLNKLDDHQGEINLI